jgi:hypothetical protein
MTRAGAMYGSRYGYMNRNHRWGVMGCLIDTAAALLNTAPCDSCTCTAHGQRRVAAHTNKFRIRQARRRDSQHIKQLIRITRRGAQRNWQPAQHGSRHNAST